MRDHKIHRRGERVIVHADRHDVVRVVRHRRGQRACRQAKPANETDRHGSTRRVAVHHRNLQQIPTRVGDRPAICDLRRHLHVPRDKLTV